MNNKARYGDPVWEQLFQKGWGKYPPEEVVRFYFRMKNKFTFPKVLDIGCGQGACTWFMAKEGAQVYAFDGAPTGLDNVPEIAKEFGVKNTFELVLGNITSPRKYISESFDILLDNYSLCSNYEAEIRNSLPDYYYILNDGGYFLMNCFGEKTTGYGTGKQLSEHTYRDVEGSLKDRGIITWFNRTRLNNMFKEIGFQIVYFEELLVENNGILTERLITCFTK